MSTPLKVCCNTHMCEFRSFVDGTSFDSGVVGDGGAGWRWEPPGDDARFSIAPGDYALPALEDFSSDAGSTGTHADVVRCGW